MNALYPSYKDGLLSKTADWVNDTIRAALYDSDAVYDPTHTNISDIAGIQIAAGDAGIGFKTAADGFAQGAPTEYASLLSPERVSIAVMYRFSDGALVAYLDTVIGFTFIPSGITYALTPGGPSGSYFAL